MSALNIVNVATINIKSNGLALATSAQDLIPALATGVSGIVEGIRIANITGSSGTAEVVTVQVVKAVGPITIRWAYQISVPAGSSLDVVNETTKKNLMEGDKVQVLAGSGSKLEAWADWKELS